MSDELEQHLGFCVSLFHVADVVDDNVAVLTAWRWFAPHGVVVCAVWQGVCAQRDVAVFTAWRWVFYFVIPRAVAESSNPGLRAFYRHFWMLRLRAA